MSSHHVTVSRLLQVPPKGSIALEVNGRGGAGVGSEEWEKAVEDSGSDNLTATVHMDSVTHGVTVARCVTCHETSH